jgi:ADP-dependent NAD(P)H-hydrate dehydratase / NAD(P)H-hydrate epimerase
VGALYLTQRIRAIERDALATTGDGELMGRAATAVADACAHLLRDLPPRTPVLALVGPGNNGGDALLAAQMLSLRGWAVRAVALLATQPAAPDAAHVWQDWCANGRVLEAPSQLGAMLAERPLVIDGLFGIGLGKPLAGDAADMVRRVRAAGVPVVSVDVPSGLDPDRGCIVGEGVSHGAADPADGPPVAMQATVTVTMLRDKPGLHTGAGSALCGDVTVASLGVPVATDPQPADGRLVGADDVEALLPNRGRNDHKGLFGDVLVIGGAVGMRGAAQLAALGARAVGAGRIYIMRPVAAGKAGPKPEPDAGAPDLMTRSLQRDASPGGALPQQVALQALGQADALVIGCGLGRDPAALHLLHLALSHPGLLVLDADALNLIAADRMLQEALSERSAQRSAQPGGNPGAVLTPHPLEAARLLGTDTASVQRDRIDAARTLAASMRVVVVLKGSGTVIAEPDGRWAINSSGGPILSVAGTGDVLAGAIGGLLANHGANRLKVADAACLAAWLHGRAGDQLAARPDYRRGIGLSAADLPAAMRACINAG